jgi:hypothetical protein
MFDEGIREVNPKDITPSIPNFIVEKTLKNGESVSLFLATRLDASTADTRQELASNMVLINPRIRIEKTIEQMEINAFDLYFLKNGDGEAIGYATVFPFEEGSCYLNKIQASAGYKNRGVATAILTQIMTDYEKIKLVDANTREDGSKEGMVRMYKKMGFIAKDGDSYEWIKSK